MKGTIRLKGGEGSGFHGHKGRPGEVGGSSADIEHIHSDVVLNEQQLRAILRPGMRYKVNDYEYGDSTALVTSLYDDQSYDDPHRVTWEHVTKQNTYLYKQSVSSFIEYLLNSKAEMRFGVGA